MYLNYSFPTNEKVGTILEVLNFETKMIAATSHTHKNCRQFLHILSYLKTNI